MKALLKRIEENERQTIGILSVSDTKFVAFTLELPDRENQVRNSRIPAGIYTVIKHTSPRFGKCFWVQNVPGRSEILIHAGNFNTDTLGCILPGSALEDINGDSERDVINSKATMTKLLELMPDKFELTIK